MGGFDVNGQQIEYDARLFARDLPWLDSELHPFIATRRANPTYQPFVVYRMKDGTHTIENLRLAGLEDGAGRFLFSASTPAQVNAWIRHQLGTVGVLAPTIPGNSGGPHVYVNPLMGNAHVSGDVVAALAKNPDLLTSGSVTAPVAAAAKWTDLLPGVNATASSAAPAAGSSRLLLAGLAALALIVLWRS